MLVGQHWHNHVHRRTSHMIPSLLCSTCLVRHTCMVFVMGSKWPDSCIVLEVLLPGFSSHLAFMDTIATLKKSSFILSNSTWTTICQQQCKPLLRLCWHHIQSMRYFYRSMWNGLLISEGFSRYDIATEVCEMVY